MVKFKTKTEKEVRDKRGNIIGSFIIRLIVNVIKANLTGAVADGFYYYINAEGEEEMLDAFNTKFNWQDVEQAELSLPTFDCNHLKEAFIQRIIEFTFIQQQIESGQNFGTVYEDWERDVEFDNALKRELNA